MVLIRRVGGGRLIVGVSVVGSEEGFVAAVFGTGVGGGGSIVWGWGIVFVID